MSPPERLLWRALKDRPGGFKFRRQHPQGPYIFDFFCFDAALAIEVDGMSHDLGDNPQRDEQRDRWAQTQGVQTLRFGSRDVRDQLEAVVASIVEACAERAPKQPLHRLRRSPSPANAGEAKACA